jgi:nicotinamidase-related amidase
MAVPSALMFDVADAALVLTDVQTKLASAMPQPVLERALRNWLVLAEMAGRLKMPVVVSEQYPEGLGHTIPAMREALVRHAPPARFVEKVEFNCCDVPLFEQFLGAGRHTYIVVGMEAHICVWQTARGLLARGYKVHVPADAIVSRTKANWRVALGLLERAGAVVTSTETVLFDALKKARGPEWRALSKLIR